MEEFIVKYWFQLVALIAFVGCFVRLQDRTKELEKKLDETISRIEKEIIALEKAQKESISKEDFLEFRKAVNDLTKTVHELKGIIEKGE